MKRISTHMMQDISHETPQRLNLSRARYLRIPLTSVLKLFTLLVAVFFLLGSAQAPGTISPEVLAQNVQNDTSAERQALEDQLAQYQKQIDDTQRTIEQYQKQGKTLKNEIAGLNAQITKLNLKIKAVTLTLNKLSGDIIKTQGQITQTETKIDEHKVALAAALRKLYESDSQSVVEILLANNTLSDFFGNLNNITLVQSNVRTALEDIKHLRDTLVAQKEELSLEKSDTENLKILQESQKQSIETIQSDKANLLQVTKGKESEYQKVLQKTKETAAQIRSKIFDLLGGGELTFDKAYNYARLAEGATGVRSAVILAILNRESLLGKNTGRCSYTSAMNPKDIPTFLNILQRLSIDPSSLVAQVSCPNSDGKYGGAMGPAQFIPSTWKLYEASISSITKNDPPNPWNNSDAFVATALYLKSIGADKQTYASEKKAAAVYYCGARWTRYACSIYASRVMDTATQFQDDINVLNGNG